jgi:hypothetical protein
MTDTPSTPGPDPVPPPGPAETPPPPGGDALAPPGPWATDARPVGAPAPPRPSAPQTILNAVKLMYVGAGLTALGIILTFVQTDAIRDAIRDSDSSLSESDLDSAVAGFVAVSVVAGLVSIGLWVWMAMANGQGKSWARIVATVLGGLNIVFTLLGMTQGGSTGLSTALSLIGLVLAAVILWLLWRPESTAYYEAVGPR